MLRTKKHHMLIKLADFIAFVLCIRSRKITKQRLHTVSEYHITSLALATKVYKAKQKIEKKEKNKNKEVR